MPKQTRMIPAYCYDGETEKAGRRARLYSIADAERLIRSSKAVPRCNRRGYLVAIVMRSELGANPMLRTMRPGQKYSTFEHIGDNTPAHAWGFIPLSGSVADFVRVLSDVSE